MSLEPDSLIALLKILGYFFVFMVTASAVLVIVLYVVDKVQTKHAIRHNYPVMGRFRYLLEGIAPFFRHHFLEDREEMPFNRAERSWVYRAAKNLDNTIPFGSSKNLTKPGTVYFTNCLFPPRNQEDAGFEAVLIGPHARRPYRHAAFFNISAMSYGAISVPAIKALSKGAAKAGIWLNTGEGGLSPYHLEGECDIVFQIGTGLFGVRDENGEFSDERLRAISAHGRVRMIELKLSQGAKPGKGGILPGIKVTEEIARIRGIPIGQDALSPNSFPAIDNGNDLLDFIAHVREVSGLPTGIKLCVGTAQDIEGLLLAVVRRGPESSPDFLTIDSGDGGTGAAPMPLIDNVGLPIRESLPLVADLLNRYGLKERIRLIASGKLITPSEVAWALCAGADYINSARGFMFALGCIQAMRCNRNTCPTGITTHNRRLQEGLNPEDKAVRVAHYANNIQDEVRTIAHACGVRHPRDLKRHHARVITSVGKSVGFDELYPNVTPGIGS